MIKRVCLFLFAIMMSYTCAFAEIPKLPTETTEPILAEISLPVDDLLKGDTVYVDVKLKESASIFAFEAVLNYDSELLEYNKVSVPDMNEQDIVIEKNESGRLEFVFSRLGDTPSQDTNKVCTVEFSSLKSGTSSVKLSSLKLVFSDMTYYIGADLSSVLDINVKTVVAQENPSTVRPSGGGSSSSSSGGRGGISVSGGGVTSSAAQVAPEPNISEEIEVADKQNTFTDVEADFWAYDAICSMSQKGIISGFGDGSFKPEQSITRAEFAKIIIGNESVSLEATTEFTDVGKDKWYFDKVMMAASIGIINGVGDGKFLPEENITREEAAVIMKRYADYKNKMLIPVRMNINFADEYEISDFAVGSIDALYISGVLSGADNGCFNPKQPISRAEAAKAIYNLYSVLGGEE